MFFNSSSAFFAPPLVILLALLIDALAGDPAWLYRLIPHPVVLIGNGIGYLEKNFNSDTVIFKGGSRPATELERVGKGAKVSLIVILAVGAVGYFIAALCDEFVLGPIVLALLASSLLAWRSLFDHVRDVAEGLRQSLDAGRAAVSRIVGRDPESLDEAGVARAGIESLAENFSDGTIAPLFWFAFLGLPGLCAYKAINTLDSMIGHRNERYEYFGKFAARLDDAVNYVPARLTGFLIAGAALFVEGADARGAFAAMFRDAPTHRSFNAGWPEAAMAGALHIALAGPRNYGGEIIEDHWMNEAGRRDATPQDIEAALRLYRVAGGLAMALLVIEAGLISLLVR
ncbi:MAG: cobalamin biosynthesis protein [Alphaproteobacteria bacterium]|nr:MAG: cobalamin biosynthesis protein [Alphaproteobacteria bacterium]